MAIETYSLTYADCVADWPDPEPSPFGVDGDRGITQTMIDDWITRGAANINSIIRTRMGADFDVSADLTEADTETIKGAIIAYAIGRALFKLRRLDTANAYMDDYRAVRDEWLSKPENYETHDGGGRVSAPNMTSADSMRYGKGVNSW